MSQFKISYEDHEYEFRGEYHDPQQGDTFLGNGGTILTLNHQPHCPWGVRAIVHLVPVRHTFGGVVFEEVGKRHARPGEWYRNHPYPEVWPDDALTDSSAKYIILKPVEVLDAEDN